MSRKKLTLNDVIDMVCWDDSESDHDEEDAIIAVQPPAERPEAETDCDSDLSDDENLGHVSHLPRRLLNADMPELEEVESTEDHQPQEKQAKKRHWRKTGFRYLNMKYFIAML